MKKTAISHLLILALPLLALSLCSSLCRRKPEICHYTVSFVNNSDSIVSICRFGWFNGKVSLDKIAESKPYDTMEITMSQRWCLEEQLSSSIQPSTNFTLCVLPETYTYVETTMDSLEISYNILKTINLVELGQDSLLKTNYTVYYP